ncbi:hypothetical protein PsorP6_000017 [Peronosclerospora sorghi]|uniref:Uncharacterized protein n=1 Tax=Peronosclerospora sorghi TaxID=230839 RepID=A0ACC0WTT2_9STRA|nr:hypothetical protein PsorP6_000017 [Peronosclerospora sorghi]
MLMILCRFDRQRPIAWTGAISACWIRNTSKRRWMGPHLKAIIDSKGTVVPNLDYRNIHRRVLKVNNYGGKRTKSSFSVKWIHDDAKDARNALIDCSLSR